MPLQEIFSFARLLLLNKKLSIKAEALDIKPITNYRYIHVMKA